VSVQMVKLHLKQGSEELFYETKLDASVDAVVRELVTLYNLKMQIARLAEHVRLLAKHGPAKPPDQRG
jgi:cilia- and flagella-associated protein 298